VGGGGGGWGRVRGGRGGGGGSLPVWGSVCVCRLLEVACGPIMTVGLRAPTETVITVHSSDSLLSIFKNVVHTSDVLLSTFSL